MIDYDWNKNNRYLAERAKCIELYKVADSSSRAKQKIIDVQDDIMNDMRKQNDAFKENYELAKQKEKKQAELLNECKQANDEKEKKLQKERQRKKVNAVLAAVGWGLAIVGIAINSSK